MLIRINNEPIPKGKKLQKIRLIDAIKQIRLESKKVVLPEEPLFESKYGRAYKIHRICRRCGRSFTVLRGYKREHVQLCQLCTDLRKFE